MTRISVRGCKRRRGAALVEMALILPLLLLLVFGIIEFGWMLRAYQAVGSVAREACRVGALGGGYTQITNRVTTAASGEGYKLTGTNDVTVEWRERANNTSQPAWTNMSTTVMPTKPTTVGNFFEIRVTLVNHYSPITGFLKFLKTSSTDPTWRLRSSVVMRRE